MASNLPLQQWVVDNYKNLSDINDYVTNLKYGPMDTARLTSGKKLAKLFSKRN